MPGIVIHVVSGQAFFTGTLCLLAGLLLLQRNRGRWDRAGGRLLWLLACAVIAISATPLPGWAYAVWLTSGAGWCWRRWRQNAGGRRTTLIPFVCCVAWTLVVMSWEASYQVVPQVPRAGRELVVVVGDSLSAEDFTEGGTPWPRLLAEQHGVQVENRAFSGAQVKSAAERIRDTDLSRALVLLEIGGNDLLGHTSTADFERGLETLLTRVCREDNTVVMLELPLPPAYNGYGRVQRRLAERFQVVLVPKRYLAAVIADTGDRVDGIHLSAAGHQKMCDMLWPLIAPALADP